MKAHDLFLAGETKRKILARHLLPKLSSGIQRPESCPYFSLAPLLSHPLATPSHFIAPASSASLINTNNHWLSSYSHFNPARYTRVPLNAGPNVTSYRPLAASTCCTLTSPGIFSMPRYTPTEPEKCLLLDLPGGRFSLTKSYARTR